MSDSTQSPPPDEHPGYAPPPPMPGPPGAGQPADLGVRFVARLIDFVLLAIVNGVLVTAIVIGVFLGTSAGAYGFGAGANWGASALSSLLTTAITVGYFVWMESWKGQTVGKMLLKLQTRGAGGGTPSLDEAFRRNIWTAIGIIGVIPFIGWISGLLSLAAVIMIAVTINNSPTRQGWHDDFAGGTSVVKTG